VTPLRGRARALWARTTVRVWPGPCVLASLPRERAGEVAGALAEAGGFVAFVVERDEVSLTLPEAQWRDHPLRPLARAESGPWSVLTLDLELPLDVTGYLAPAAAALAAAAVPIVPQCAFSKDHLLVPADKLTEAVRALDALIEDARQGEAG
jgi:hypothetical protein